MCKDAPFRQVIQSGEPETGTNPTFVLCLTTQLVPLCSDFVQLSVYFSYALSSWCSSGWTPACPRYGMDSEPTPGYIPPTDNLNGKRLLFFPMIASYWPDFEEHAYLAPVPLASSLISCLGICYGLNCLLFLQIHILKS